jgi:exodeoxyribonuclease-3
MAVTVATWNVNSLRIRLQQVTTWLAANQVDILALQETKLTDPDFPRDALEALGYQVLFSGQKSYNGVALLSRASFDSIVIDIPDFDDPPRRVLAATTNGWRIDPRARQAGRARRFQHRPRGPRRSRPCSLGGQRSRQRA